MTQPQQPAGAESAGDDQPHRPADDREEIYFHGSPLLRGAVGTGLLWMVIGLVLIAVPLAFGGGGWPWWAVLAMIVLGLIALTVPWIMTRTVRYRISNYRIDYERGLLGRRIDTLELWHVEDISFRQSLIDRILGVGTIRIISHDQTTPMLVLRGLPQPRALFDSLKQRIIAVKRQRGVIKMDVG